MSDDSQRLEEMLKQIVARISPAVAQVLQSNDASMIRLHFKPGGEFSGGKLELSL